MKTAELMGLLKRHYLKPIPMPGGIFVPEVGRNGSSAGSRRCDAIHVGFTSTSGRILTGHEVKVSRADWLRELAKPGKADEWADDCHAWYVVASEPGVVQPSELPPGWGLLLPGKSRTRMRTVVHATVNMDVMPSWDTMRSILSRLDTLQRERLADVRDEMNKARDVEVEKEIARRAERDEKLGRGRVTPEIAERLRALDRLEEALGMTVASWVRRSDTKVDAKLLGAALQLVDATDALWLGPNLARELAQVAEQVGAIQTALTEFKQHVTP